MEETEILIRGRILEKKRRLGENQVKPQVYIESGISINREVSRIYKEQNLDRSRGIEEVSMEKIFDGSKRY